MNLSTLRSWWRGLAGRGALERQIADEFRFHLDARADDLVTRHGLTRPAALRRAQVEFGSVEKFKEEGRQSFGLRLVDECRTDLRFAARTFARNKVFSATAVATLALGIGANTAVFSALDALRLRTLPVERPEDLVVFDSLRKPDAMVAGYSGESRPGPGGTSLRTAFSMLTFERFRDHATTMTQVFAIWSPGSLNVVAGGQAEVASGQLVSGAYFDGLGVKARVGRPLRVDDDRLDAAPAAVISDRYWQQRFAGDPTVVGTAIGVNRSTFTIVGVTAKGFDGTRAGESPDITLPLSAAARISATGRTRPVSTWWVEMMGRLKPGVTREQVLAEVRAMFTDTVHESWEARAPTTPNPSRTGIPELRVMPGARGRHAVQITRTDPLVLAFGVVGIILLIGCANLATLLLARASSRRQEVAMRMALGASRRRVIRQFLTESLFLSLVGGACGALLAYWGKDVAAWLPDLDTSADTRIDVRVLLFATGLSAIAAVGFGIGPALRATRIEVGSWLKMSAQKGGAARGVGGRLLIAAQVALSVVLLTTAGLLARTVYNFSQVDLGFNPSHLLVFDINPGPQSPEASTSHGLYDRLMGAIEAVPGVEAATLSAMPVVARSEWSEQVRAEGGGQSMLAFLQTVRWNFLNTMGMPLLGGRDLAATDVEGRPRVAVINQTMAKQLFGTPAALGRHFHFENGPKVLIEVVGIVRDAKYARLDEPAPPTFYEPYPQVPPGSSISPNKMIVEIRTATDPLDLAPQVRAAVRAIDAELPMVDVRTEEQQINETIKEPRAFAMLTGSAALAGVLLACLGLYGVVSQDVSRRTAEIGIRMALGARPIDVTLLVVRQIVGVVAIGAIAGAALSRTATGLIKGMLFEIAADDPLMKASAGVLLVAIASFAAYLPARRAARLDPTHALRSE